MACITLISDFGLRDASVAIAKGVLMQHVPQLPVIDISHEIKPFHKGQAAYLFSAAYKNFPVGTFHVILFDLFSEKTPRLVLSTYAGHYFLAPDNGVLPLALGSMPEQSWLCFELSGGKTFAQWLDNAGQSISQLQTKRPADMGLPACPLKTTSATKQVTGINELSCEVLHVDHYENVVINFTKEQFEAMGHDRPFHVTFRQVEEITEISNNYSDVREGYKLCRFNSNGYLEICINKGRAASLFGLRLGGIYNDVKISF